MNVTNAAEIRIAILKTGSTYTELERDFGDFENWFEEYLNQPAVRTTVIDVTGGKPDSQPSEWDGIVVTGSPAMVSDKEAWSEDTARWLAQAVTNEVPVFGVCYGHQLLAHAMGGKVGYHPNGRETGTHEVELTEASASDPLFCSLPKTFRAQLTHKQSVLELPDNAVLLARNDFEPHESFRIGQWAWGVQFHPEFSADIMRGYLRVQTPELKNEGITPETLLDNVSPTPEATSLLTRFVELVRQRKAT